LATTKGFGILLIIVSMLLLLAGVSYLFMATSPLPSLVKQDPTLTGYAAGGAGLLALLLGVVLLVIAPKPAVPIVVPVTQPALQTVEIKRTEMNWGSGARPAAQADASEDLSGRLEGINQRLGRLKVQYGMGELSNESYKTITTQLEQEKADIELRLYQGKG
jgi:hypothetical protein